MRHRLYACILLSYASLAAGLCGCPTVCETLAMQLGNSPSGCAIKRLFHLQTILFENPTQYNFSCTCATGNTAQLVFMRTENHSTSNVYFNHWQHPACIQVAVNRQIDGSLMAYLPQ